MRGERQTIWEFACELESVTNRLVRENCAELSTLEISRALREMAKAGHFTVDEKRGRYGEKTYRPVKANPPKGSGKWERIKVPATHDGVKLTDEQCQQLREIYTRRKAQDADFGYRAAARIFRVSMWTARDIIVGKTRAAA